eukprot:UN27460
MEKRIKCVKTELKNKNEKINALETTIKRQKSEILTKNVEIGKLKVDCLEIGKLKAENAEYKKMVESFQLTIVESRRRSEKSKSKPRVEEALNQDKQRLKKHLKWYNANYGAPSYFTHQNIYNFHSQKKNDERWRESGVTETLREIANIKENRNMIIRYINEKMIVNNLKLLRTKNSDLN